MASREARRLALKGAAAFLCVSSLVLGASPARASCSAPDRALLWSYPSHGDVEVPTNADLFVTGDPDGLPTINGETLSRISSGVYELRELAPHTTYDVRWSSSEPNATVISFTTGAGPRQGPAPVPSEKVVITRNPESASGCPLVERQGCFDQGPPTRVRFDSGAASIAWIVTELTCDGSTREMIWPAECGSPVLEREERVVCARLRASDGVGSSEPTDFVCSAPVLPQGVSLPTQSSCVGAWPPEHVLTITSRDDVAAPSGNGAAISSGANETAVEGGCALVRQSQRRGHHGQAVVWMAALMLLTRRRQG